MANKNGSRGFNLPSRFLLRCRLEKLLSHAATGPTVPVRPFGKSETISQAACHLTDHSSLAVPNVKARGEKLLVPAG